MCYCVCPQFDLDSIWMFIFGVSVSSGAALVGSLHNVCTEAAFLLLAMLRSMLNLVHTHTLISTHPCAHTAIVLADEVMYIYLL